MKKPFDIRYALLLLPLITAVTSSPTLNARQLSPAQAWQTALTHDASAPDRIIKSRHTASTPRVLATETAEGLNTVYIMESQPDSTIYFISADDVAVPLLGYCDSKGFNADSMPDNMRWWLSQYSAEIAESCCRNPETSDISADLSLCNIQPMLTTRWDQGFPYNLHAPDINFEVCYTGCVATAIAQIMNYHRHPLKGTGSITYDWPSGNSTLSHDFSADTYDWDNMADTYNNNDSYTPTQMQAVSRLMVACGYAVQTDYSPSGSASFSHNVISGLTRYFDYSDNIRMITRSNYPLPEWIALLHSELQAGRPIYYAGDSNRGGHAFVIDGYRNSGSLFHVNWGWSGRFNGYFVISVLDPNIYADDGSLAGFYTNQEAVINIRPKLENDPAPTPEFILANTISTTSESFLRGNQVVLPNRGARFSIYGTGNRSFPAKFGFRITDLQNGEQFYYFNDKEETIFQNTNYHSGPLYFNSELLTHHGKYALDIVACSSGEIYPVRTPFDGPSQIILEYSGSRVYILPSAANIIKASGLTFISSPYLDDTHHLLEFKATLTAGDSEYLGPVVPLFVNPSTAERYRLKAHLIDIPANSSTEHEWSVEFPADITAGRYQLYLLDCDDRYLCNGLVFDLKEPLAEPHAVSLNSLVCKSSLGGSGTQDAPYIVDPEYIEVEASLSNAEGYYFNTISANIPTDNRTILDYVITRLEADKTRNYRFIGNAPEMEPDITYPLYLEIADNNDGYIALEPAIYVTKNLTSGIKAPCSETESTSINISGSTVTASAESGVASLALYNSAGQKIAIVTGCSPTLSLRLPPLTPSVYIVMAIIADGTTMTQKFTVNRQ